MMKLACKSSSKAFTLTEVMLVVGLLVGMLGLSFWGFQGWIHYQQGMRIEAGLNLVATAQMRYLRDNPTRTYEELNMALLSPYFPMGQQPIWPDGTVTSVTTFPPTATYGGRTWSAKQY